MYLVLGNWHTHPIPPQGQCSPFPTTFKPYPQPSSGDPDPGVRDFQQSLYQAGSGAEAGMVGVGGSPTSPLRCPSSQAALKETKMNQLGAA